MATPPAVNRFTGRTGRGSRGRPGGITDDIGLHEQPARPPPAQDAPAASATRSDCMSSRRGSRRLRTAARRSIAENQIVQRLLAHGNAPGCEPVHRADRKREPRTPRRYHRRHWTARAAGPAAAGPRVLRRHRRQHRAARAAGGGARLRRRTCSCGITGGITGGNQLIGSGRVRGGRRWLRGTTAQSPPGPPTAGTDSHGRMDPPKDLLADDG